MCQLTLTRDGSPDHPASLALAQDYESYRAYLLTAPEFGCVQWEQTSVALTKQPTSE